MGYQFYAVGAILLWSARVVSIMGRTFHFRVMVGLKTRAQHSSQHSSLALYPPRGGGDSLCRRPRPYPSQHAGTRKSSERVRPTVIHIEDIYSDLWQVQSVSKILLGGGMGVVSTDTSYSFVTLINSAAGVSRLIKLKSVAGQKKPLSLLCRDLSMASQYTQSMERNWVYKVMKAALPGPFTFILPSSKLVPQLVISGKVHSRRWRRREIGIRIPEDPVVAALFEELQLPLLSGSVPSWNDEDYHDIADNPNQDSSISDKEDPDDGLHEDIEATPPDPDELPISSAVWPWYHSVDFIVDTGRRGGSREDLSTVVDLTGDDPVVLRSGRGVLK